MLFQPYLRCHVVFLSFFFFIYVRLTEWPTIGKIAAHSAYDMYLIVNLVFPPRFFGVGISF